MDSIAFQTLLIAICVGVSCALLGSFLVLRKMSMMIDAISHTVLLGIVLAYMVVQDLTSPWLMIGSTIAGVMTVVLIELLVKSKRTSEDTATGTIFPFLFSLAIIIITTRFRNTHLDMHAISGNLEFAAYEPLVLFGVTLGSKTLYTNLLVLLLILLTLYALFKEFKLSSFDSALAKTLGLMPAVLQYVLMTMVSLTAVTSFNAVGSILVVAMMIGPGATSLLMTKDLKMTLWVSGLIASFNAILGYFIAMFVFSGQVNISATIASVTLITFLLVWTFEPNKGLVIRMIRKSKQKKEFEVLALLMHIVQHEKTLEEQQELGINTLPLELNWSPEHYHKVLERGIAEGYLKISNQLVSLTKQGKQYYIYKLNKLGINL